MGRISLDAMRKTVSEKDGHTGSNFWNPIDAMRVGESTKAFILPYIDPVSGGYWTVRKTLAASFTNPDNPDEAWKVYIPSLENYVPFVKTKCPVAALPRALFKEADAADKAGEKERASILQKVASSHWMHYNFMYQGFVINPGSTPVDPDVITPISHAAKSIHKIVEAPVTQKDSGFTTLPTGSFDENDLRVFTETGVPPEGMTADDFKGNLFIFSKTTRDEHNNYDTSTWGRELVGLNDKQIDYILENGLLDMTKFLPPRPTEEQYDVYVEILQASIDIALGNTTDTAWNPEWEAVGIEPVKPKKDDKNSSGGGSKSGSSLRESLRNRRTNVSADASASGEETKGLSVSDLRKTIATKRGVTQEADTSASDDANESSDDQSQSAGNDASNDIGAGTEGMSATDILRAKIHSRNRG